MSISRTSNLKFSQWSSERGVPVPQSTGTARLPTFFLLLASPLGLFYLDCGVKLVGWQINGTAWINKMKKRTRQFSAGFQRLRVHVRTPAPHMSANVLFWTISGALCHPVEYSWGTIPSRVPLYSLLFPFVCFRFSGYMFQTDVNISIRIYFVENRGSFS